MPMPVSLVRFTLYSLQLHANYCSTMICDCLRFDVVVAFLSVDRL